MVRGETRDGTAGAPWSVSRRRVPPMGVWHADPLMATRHGAESTIRVPRYHR